MIDARRILGPLGLTLASIVIIVSSAAALAPALVAAMVTEAPEADPDRGRIQNLIDSHGEEVALYRDRFEGRSPFFPPDPPPPPAPDRTTTEVRERPEQRNVGPAPTYEGPLRGPSILGDKVRFASINDWVRVGESRQGVEVARIEPPYTVVVRWTRPSTPTEVYEEGEYELRVFERAFSDANSPFRTSAPDTDGQHPGLKVVPRSTSSGAPPDTGQRQSVDDQTFEDEENDDEEN